MMVSKDLFKTRRGMMTPHADAVNRAGGLAYGMSSESALAQFAATCCFGGSYYTSPAEQVEMVLKIASEVESTFLAKTAIYSRTKAFMKDMPAVLLAILSTRQPLLMRAVAPRVLDNGRMVRNFVQVLRSGVTGRKSLGTAPRNVVRDALNRMSSRQLFNAAVGKDPSIADVLKMVHPRPESSEREALHGYLIGKEVNEGVALPEFVKQFEAWKKAPTAEPPDVEFRYLTGIEMPEAAWVAIARNAKWHMTRMNLNTFARHGVLKDAETAVLLANRLKDAEIIQKAKVFPYQLLAAWMHIDRTEVPSIIVQALHYAMEVATRNVPKIEGGVIVCPDVSASMGCPVTGYGHKRASKVRCIDVAGLVASSIARTNPGTTVIPFDTVPRSDVWIDPADSVMTNANRIRQACGGGTACSVALAFANRRELMSKLVVFVSDSESWVDSRGQQRWQGTKMMEQWQIYKTRVPDAKLMCIDVVANDTCQAPDGGDILNVGGFTDQVFTLMERFAAGNPEKFREEIDKIELEL